MMQSLFSLRLKWAVLCALMAVLLTGCGQKGEDVKTGADVKDALMGDPSKMPAAERARIQAQQAAPGNSSGTSVQ